MPIKSCIRDVSDDKTGEVKYYLQMIWFSLFFYDWKKIV